MKEKCIINFIYVKFHSNSIHIQLYSHYPESNFVKQYFYKMT